MNILITGGSGELATNLMSHFSNDTVYSLSRKDNADYTIDLSSSHPKFDIIKDKIDVVLHCAYVIPYSVDDDVEELFEQNKLITENTISLVNYLKPNVVVHISSIAVYPNISGVFNEKSKVDPDVNWNKNYAYSKLYTEKRLSEGINTTMNVSHLRVSQILTDNYSDALQKSFFEELKEKNTITVFANGERESNFIYVSRLAVIIDKVIKKGLNGVFNCGDFQQNYLEFAEKFISENGDSKSKIILVEKGSKTIFRLDCSKLEQALISF